MGLLVMTVRTGFVAFLAAAGALVAAPTLAQTAPATSAAASASVKSVASSTGKWTCVSTATVEIAPVSFDTSGQAKAWVMVHRVKGEIIAAERISAREAEQLRRLPCGTRDGDDGGIALVG